MDKLKSAIKNRKKQNVSRGRPTVVFQGNKRNLAYYDPEIYHRLKLRKQTLIDFNGRDATPQALTETDLTELDEEDEDYKQKRSDSLWDTLIASMKKRKFMSLSSLAKDPNVESLIPDLNEICGDLARIKVAGFSAEEDDESELSVVKTAIEYPKPRKFVEILLRETENFDIFDCPNLIIPKGTKEAKAVEERNALYHYKTKGAGLGLPRSNAEIQTEIFPPKCRGNNTEEPDREVKGTHASNFEIFQAYSAIEETVEELGIEGTTGETVVVTTHSREGSEDFSHNLFNNEQFQVSSMIIERLLAENIYRKGQKKLRNIGQELSNDASQELLYELQKLWRYESFDTKGKEVVDMCWCPSNSDMTAVAYGVYNYRESKHRIAGAVMIWNIKNPVNPERHYHFAVPVTSVAFSQLNPKLLAVGFYNGKIEVIDISEIPLAEKSSTVSRSNRETSLGIDPVWSCCWSQDKGEEFIVTSSQDGRVMKYELGSGPNLIGRLLMSVERVEGKLEGLETKVLNQIGNAADRHSQILCLEFHPLKDEIYFVGTDQGCIHMCSVNLTSQHKSVFQAHKFGIYCIQFSPFEPKIFLTAGNDFTIRIWEENESVQLLLELVDDFDGVHNACWSPLNSTVIISCTKSAAKVWDLRRRNQKPASILTISGKDFTIAKFSPGGQVFVGDTEGNTHVFTPENFPSPPHFQHDALMSAVRPKI